VIRPSWPALACYLTCWPFSLDAETSQTQPIPAIGQLADCFRPCVNNPVCNDRARLVSLTHRTADGCGCPMHPCRPLLFISRNTVPWSLALLTKLLIRLRV
jgi:hypothetical protein